MDDINVKSRIFSEAVKLFSLNGFHGTSMRDIAQNTGCSLPTLYYYFHNKQDLFDEIVINEFFRINDSMIKKIDFKLPPEELYLQVIRTRKDLSPHDKSVYKLAMKVWLGFEGEGKAREKLMEWEGKRTQSNIMIIKKYVDDQSNIEDFTDIFVNFLENIMNKIIFNDAEIDDYKIKRQITLLFSMMNKNNKL